MILVAGVGCAENQPGAEGREVALSILGEFLDDYGIEYSISETEWIQHEDARYHIEVWDVEAQFLVAQNDSLNPGEPNLWTRIDWVLLEDGNEYDWGFCYAVYDALSAQAAIMAPSTDRATPRTGCNGHPFSRMRRNAVQPHASRGD